MSLPFVAGAEWTRVPARRSRVIFFEERTHLILSGALATADEGTCTWSGDWRGFPREDIKDERIQSGLLGDGITLAALFSLSPPPPPLLFLL